MARKRAIKKRNKKRAFKRKSLLTKIITKIKTGIRLLGEFLPEKTKTFFLSAFIFLLAIIFVFSFFKKAGKLGVWIEQIIFPFLGQATYFCPLVLFLLSFSLLGVERKYYSVLFLATVLLVIGFSGFFHALEPSLSLGGRLGLFLAKFLISFWGQITTILFYGFLVLFSGVIFWQSLSRILPKKKKEKEEKQRPSLFKKVFVGLPKFKKIRIEPEFRPQEQKEIIASPSPEKKLEAKEKLIKSVFAPPPIELLEEEKEKPQAADIKQNSFLITKTLKDFGIEAVVTEVNVGPTVTQYAIKPAEGIRLSKIVGLTNNLALALASHPVRIEAPIPGKPLVGIEVPNKIRSKVRLRSLISQPEFQNASSLLTVAIGKDVAGKPVFMDLARCPHLLVAGATGTGKTIFLNSLVLSLLYRNGIDTLRLILIDPKRVEFPVYNDLPHLLCPVIFDPQRAVIALKWLIGEMERRFDLLSEAKTKDINSYNRYCEKTKKGEKLPFIILIIDELADLMAAKGKEIEAGIVRLAQMSRAVGIHLVVATQRPSVEVLTGLIKANITSRIAFQVASQFDSRTILDVAGAEKLLGRGDMLFLSAETVKPKRIQGAYVSEQEVRRVVEWILFEFEKAGKGKDNHLAIDLEKNLKEPEAGFGDEYLDDDPLYEEAKRVVIRAGKASASLLQRRLRIGYARAARLLDMLEENGIVGPPQGAKPREVYLTEQDLEQS